MPVLYGVSPSPFVRKVRGALSEKGIEYELEAVMPGNTTERFRAISPLGKIPVYQDGDFTLPDSSVICAYLERTHPDPALYPTEAREYGRALWYEEYADTKLVEVIGPIFSQRVLQTIIFKQPCDEAIVERQLATLIPPVFDYLEQELEQQLEQELEGEMRDDRWLVGDSFGIADLSIGSMFVSLRHAKESVDHARWPRLGAYVDRVHARPSLAALIAEEEASLASL